MAGGEKEKNGPETQESRTEQLMLQTPASVSVPDLWEEGKDFRP